MKERGGRAEVWAGVGVWAAEVGAGVEVAEVWRRRRGRGARAGWKGGREWKLGEE